MLLRNAYSLIVIVGLSAMGVSFSHAQSCPAFPISVLSESELSSAIACYNDAPSGNYTISLSNSILLNASPVSINNSNGAALTIDGQGYLIDGDDSFRPIDILGGSVTLNDVVLLNGSADNGGAINVADGLTFVLQNSTVVSSAAIDNGGALFAGEDSDITVSNSRIGSSTATSGGGIYIGANANGTLTDTTIFSHSASGPGGGLFIASGAEVEIAGAIIVDSTASQGGGIANNGELTVQDSYFAGNASASGGGLRNNGELALGNSSLTGNSTTRSGEGGGLSNYGTAIVDATTAFENTAAFGAALYTRGALTVSNSTISTNTATALAGGVYIFWTGSLDAYNSSLSGNSANVGGTLLNNGGSATLNNTIIANSPRGSNCYGSYGDTGSIADDASCGGIVQSDSINLGPLADNGCTRTHATPTGPACVMTHSLGTDSVAIATGDGAICDAEPVSGMDHRGYDRFAECDVGAYESAQETCFVISVRGSTTVPMCVDL